jgi:hypothetical protein
VNFKNKAFLLAVFGFGMHLKAQAQITNDSTVQLYGPKSTRVIYEKEFFRGNYEEVPVDTSLNNIYSNLYWYADTTFQQTLENIGLATKPMLFQLPRRIGVRLGRNVYDYYAYQSDDITYFDTRSPYTKLDYKQGSLGEGIFEAEFSRNIRKWWNAGIAYHRISATKQIGATTRKDLQVDDNGLKFYTHLQSTNNRYHLFANYLHMNHQVVETGGVRPNPGNKRSDLFDFLTENIWLTHATARDMRHTFHVGQTFALAGEMLKVFYDLDERRQLNRFDDTQLRYENSEGVVHRLVFYPQHIYNDSTETRDRSIYSELENTGGITGNQKYFFYKAYLKNRNASVARLTENPQSFNQTFIGGEGELLVNEKIKTAFRGEYKVPNEYFIQAEARFLFLGGQYTRMVYAPDLMQQTYSGNHHRWNNDFDNISADRASVWISGSLWHNSLRLELANLSLKNYVFYNQQQRPQQAISVQRLQTAVADHKFTLGKLHWNNIVAYTYAGKAAFIRVPDWVVNSKLYYQGYLFKKALFGQIGLETTFRSDYLADAYSPALQQFYLQDNFRVENYPIIDAFVAVDIKSVNIFLKLAHANEGLNGPGYFTTPFYPGMRRSFFFGVKWMFFD